MTTSICLHVLFRYANPCMVYTPNQFAGFFLDQCPEELADFHSLRLEAHDQFHPLVREYILPGKRKAVAKKPFPEILYQIQIDWYYQVNISKSNARLIQK